MSLVKMLLNLRWEGWVLTMLQSLNILKHPPEEKINHVHHMMIDDRQLIINPIANAINISLENILFNSLMMSKDSASLITIGQKLVSRENIALFEADLPGLRQYFLTQDV